MILEIVAVRHAPVAVQGLIYGQSNVPLKLTTAEAADEVERRLDERGDPWDFDAVWASPWERTEPVAREVGRRRGLEVRIDSRLSETGFGVYENTPFAEIERRDPAAYRHWVSNWLTVVPEGGETGDAVMARVGQWLEERRGDSRRLLVVTHAGVIRVLRCHLEGITFADALKVPVQNLDPTVFAFFR